MFHLVVVLVVGIFGIQAMDTGSIWLWDCGAGWRSYSEKYVLYSEINGLSFSIVNRSAMSETRVANFFTYEKKQYYSSDP